MAKEGRRQIGTPNFYSSLFGNRTGEGHGKGWEGVVRDPACMQLPRPRPGGKSLTGCKVHVAAIITPAAA